LLGESAETEAPEEEDMLAAFSSGRG
jgi:hypothetical protein